MPVPVQRLIAYYQSPAFAADHAILMERRPLAALQQRQTIIANLNANFATEGIAPTAAQLADQERFVDGTLSMPDMLEHIEQYVASIALRWPEAPSS
jgi:hypothetical protein